jgi:hypothetical protein
MAFKGWDPVRTKIVIDNKTIEQVKLFDYLGNMISCERELDIEKKLLFENYWYFKYRIFRSIACALSIQKRSEIVTN